MNFYKKMRVVLFLVSSLFLISILFTNEVSACGYCYVYDAGPKDPACDIPGEYCPEYGLQHKEKCGSDCECETDQCDCGNGRHWCGPCPCTHGCSCSPSCPSGTSTSYSGPLCDRGRKRCSCTDDCGDTFTYHSDPHCYDPETNTRTVAVPTGLNMTFNSLTLPLSQDSALRSLVMNPMGEAVGMSMPAYSLAGARQIVYAFRANNQNSGSDWTNFTVPARSEDIIKETTSSSTSFDPALGADPVLEWNYIGRLWNHNGARNRCDDGIRWSGPREGFYRVNTLPTVTSVTRTSGNGIVASGVAEGCTTDSYSGREVNNPISFSIRYSDVNHAMYQDIEALYVWFSNNTTGAGNPPTITNISTSGTNNGSSDDTFGFMIRKEGATWNSVPNLSNEIGNTGGLWGGDGSVYVSSNSGGTWTMLRVGDGIIRGQGGTRRARVNGISVSQVGNDMVMDFDIEFFTDDAADVDMVSDGEYRVFGGASDHFSLLPLGGSALRRQPQWNNRGMTWRIDLREPEFNPMAEPLVISALKMSFDVSTTDGYSGVSRILGDGLRTGVLSQIENVAISSVVDDPAGTGNTSYLGSSVPYTPDLGGVNWANQQATVQKYNLGDHLWTALNPTHEVTVNIGDSEGGGFAFYGTAFDRACNYSDPGGNSVSNYPDIGSPWMMTKAGLFYSDQGSQVLVKDFDPAITDDYDFNTHSNPVDALYNDIFGFNKAETQLGSALMESSTAFINEFLLPDLTGSFRIFNYSHDSDRANYWFDHLYERHQKTAARYPGRFNYLDSASFATFASGGSKKLMSSLPLNSYEAHVVEYVGDLAINSNFICNEKTLIVVFGNITLNPDIMREDPANHGAADVHAGCIFLTNGSVTLAEGSRASGSLTPSYDLIEGLVIAENQITIPEADTDPNLPVARDGLKVHGSLYAFGSNSSTGVIPDRTLKLADNVIYPAEAIHYDPRYLELVEFFFGGDNYTYKREIGWKPTSL